MKTITSSSNPTIKHIRHLLVDRRYRHKESAFVVEGSRWILELAEFPAWRKQILASISWWESTTNQQIIERLDNKVTLVDDKVMTQLSVASTPPGILAEVHFPKLRLARNQNFLLILDKIRDPGNMGTMIRSASAAGVDGILIPPESVDIYNPKVVQGSMGALLRVPVMQSTWEEIKQLTFGFNILLSKMDGEHLYTAIDWKKPSAIIIGSEAEGPGIEAEKMATGSVYIPMERATESLNAASAAAVLLFEVARQRR